VSKGDDVQADTLQDPTNLPQYVMNATLHPTHLGKLTFTVEVPDPTEFLAGALPQFPKLLGSDPHLLCFVE
jgi:hypothetical protein